MSVQTDIVSSLSNPEEFIIQAKQKKQITEGSKILTFIMCVIAIYSCLIINGIIEERIYKVPYAKINSSQNDFYTDSISPMILTSFFAILIGLTKMQDQDISVQIPLKKLVIVAGMEVVIHVLLMISLIKASYAVVVMANSSSLLSVIIIGVLFSKSKKRSNQSYNPNNNEFVVNESHSAETNQNRQTQNQKLGIQKIWICVIVILGVYLFNMYAPPKLNQTDKSSNSLTILTIVILLFAIFLQGLKPQLQIRIKNQYQPSPICFYYNINKIICPLTLIFSIVSTNFFYTIDFIINHDELLFHLVIMALLNSICIMFIYKIITIFRQHVYPLVSTVRKCLTVAVNLIYFHHSVSIMQIFGIVLVFGGVFLQIVLNYKLCKKYDIDIPFANQQKKQRYVKNQMSLSESRKKYQIYKVIQNGEDIVGI